MRPLIFLFGLPRSGTTWLGKIFDSHPLTIYRHEPDSRGALDGMPLFPGPSDTDRCGPTAKRFVGSLPHMNGVKIAASVPVFRKDYLSPPRYWAKRTTIFAARIASRVYGEMPVTEWVDYDHLPSAPLVWKSVESAGRLGLFGASFSSSRGILVLRHPCGHLASLFRSVELGKVTARNSAFEDFGIVELLLQTEQAHKYGLTMDHFRGMTPAQRLAWRWVVVNEKAIEDTSGLHNCRIVRYEDVCKDPIGASKELFRFALLSWAPQTERFIDTSTTTENAAYYSIFKNPLRAANQWQSELDGQTIDQIMGVVRATSMSRYYGADI